MIYFGYPLDIHGWKTKPETEPETKPETETENRGWETIPKPETAGPETRGYPTRTRSAAISRQTQVVSHVGRPVQSGWSDSPGDLPTQDLRWRLSPEFLEHRASMSFLCLIYDHINVYLILWLIKLVSLDPIGFPLRFWYSESLNLKLGGWAELFIALLFMIRLKHSYLDLLLSHFTITPVSRGLHRIGAQFIWFLMLNHFFSK
jgi:hypothetical protein